MLPYLEVPHQLKREQGRQTGQLEHQRCDGVRQYLSYLCRRRALKINSIAQGAGAKAAAAALSSYGCALKKYRRRSGTRQNDHRAPHKPATSSDADEDSPRYIADSRAALAPRRPMSRPSPSNQKLDSASIRPTGANKQTLNSIPDNQKNLDVGPGHVPIKKEASHYTGRMIRSPWTTTDLVLPSILVVKAVAFKNDGVFSS